MVAFEQEGLAMGTHTHTLVLRDPTPKRKDIFWNTQDAAGYEIAIAMHQ